MGELHGKGVLTVLVGPPGCGKSEMAAMLAELYGYSIVSPDAIRGDLFGDPTVQDDPDRVFSIAYEAARLQLPNGGVVFDATNCRKEYRKVLLDELRGYYSMAIAFVSRCTIEECLFRNEKRKRRVPEHVIWNMYKRLLREPPTLDEGFDVIVYFGGDDEPWRSACATSS